jgi:hypothetical protein
VLKAAALLVLIAKRQIALVAIIEYAHTAELIMTTVDFLTRKGHGYSRKDWKSRKLCQIRRHGSTLTGLYSPKR